MKTRSLSDSVKRGVVFAVIWSTLYATLSVTFVPMNSLEKLHASEQNLVPVSQLDLWLGLVCIAVGLFIFFASNYYLVGKEEGSAPGINGILVAGLAVFVVIYLTKIYIQGVSVSDFLKVSQGASYLRVGLLILAALLILTVINFVFNFSFSDRKKA